MTTDYSTAVNRTKIIAHRGYWKVKNASQNSISSLQNAARIGVYGTEFDVLLTRDDIPVVIHGPEHGGMTVEKTLYSDLLKEKLGNGEHLPTLEEYLAEAVKHKKLRLILEIKALSSPEKETLAISKILGTVEAMGLKGRVEYTSFSLHACKEVVRMDPRAKVFYLFGDMTPPELKEMGFAGFNYLYSVVQKHPEWIAQTKTLGLISGAWTVDSTDAMKEMIGYGVDFITTNEPEKLQALLK